MLLATIASVRSGRCLAGNARRAGEVAARYGGEEFAVLLPNALVGVALEVAQRICNDVRELNIPHKASTAAAHVSVGVACALRALDLAAGDTPLSDQGAHAGKSRSAPTILVEMAIMLSMLRRKLVAIVLSPQG